MLPSHYCDFLLALYQQGEGIENKNKRGKKSILITTNNTKRNLLFLLSFLTLGSLLYLFLATSYIIISLSVVSILLICLLIFAFRQRKSNIAVKSFLYILSALLLLGISMKIWILFFADQPLVLISLIVGNCVLWILTGRLLKLIYFTISGSTGIVISLYYLFFY